MTVKLLFPSFGAIERPESRLESLHPRIDYHAHVFLRSLPMDQDRRYSPAEDAPLSEYRSLLEQHGVDGAVLVQPSFLGTDNSYILNALVEARAWRDGPMTWGVVVVPPDTPRGVLYSMKAAGVVGVRLNMIGGPLPDFGSKVWTGFFDRVNSLGWHVELHIEGHRLPGVLSLLLDRCERIAVDHFGLPDPGSPFSCPGFQALLQAPPDRVWIKATAPRRVFSDLGNAAAAARCAELFWTLEDRLGHGALLWGSDWPWTQHANGQSFADTIGWHRDWRGRRDGGRRSDSASRGPAAVSAPGTADTPGSL